MRNEFIKHYLLGIYSLYLINYRLIWKGLSTSCSQIYTGGTLKLFDNFISGVLMRILTPKRGKKRDDEEE
jgi:hypothetical protein